MKLKGEISKRGQAIVELAIVFSLFVIIILVIFDLGRVVYFYSAIHNAAQEGARHGITDPDQARIIEAARHLAAGLAIDPIVDLSDSDKVTVRIEYQFSPATPVLRILTGSDTITLVSQATMYREK
jgi:Flp pilus assembly protein TadG